MKQKGGSTLSAVVKDVVGKYISCFLARVRFSGGYVFCDRGSCSLCIGAFPTMKGDVSSANASWLPKYLRTALIKLCNSVSRTHRNVTCWGVFQKQGRLFPTTGAPARLFPTTGH